MKAINDGFEREEAWARLLGGSVTSSDLDNRGYDVELSDGRMFQVKSSVHHALVHLAVGLDRSRSFGRNMVIPVVVGDPPMTAEEAGKAVELPGITLSGLVPG